MPSGESGIRTHAPFRGQVRVLPAISAHLYHFGIRLLSHILTGIGPFLKPVELAGEVHAEVLSPIPGCRIGTGGSLGVDSLCTIAELEKAGTPVTHLFHNNCGSHWGNRELLEGRRKLSRNFAEKNGMEFVWMDSIPVRFLWQRGIFELVSLFGFRQCACPEWINEFILDFRHLSYQSSGFHHQGPEGLL